MEFVTTLWLPILVSAVVVFVASAITHMVLGIHKHDFTKLPDEDKVRGSLEGVPAGMYSMPYCEPKDMNTPEGKAKFASGPIGFVTIMPGQVNMGTNLGLTFLFYLFVGIFVAYLGSHSILPGEDYLRRFQICGAVAFAAHGLGWMPFLIWYRGGKFWPNFIDSIIYALLTAGVFASMWPHISLSA